MEFLHFEAEADSKELMSKFISKLDAKSIKLSGFSETLKVKAGKAKAKFPKKHDWVAFFRDSKVMDESKPGERPDTIHIKGLPFKWFEATAKNQGKPSEQLIWDVFNQYGAVRAVDVPVLDAYRMRMDIPRSEDDGGFKTFSFGSGLYFEVFVQFSDYTGFEKAMQVFKGRKLIHLLEDGKTAAVNIIVDFDQSAHLSERNIKKRDIQRQKLIDYDLQEEEIARKVKEQEELVKEMVRLEEIQKEEEKIREMEEEKQIKQQKRKIKEQNRKLKKIQKKIFMHKRKREKEEVEKRELEMVELRKKQARYLMMFVLEGVEKKKKKERKEKIKRNKELKMLHQLEAKKQRKDEKEEHRIKIEYEKQEQLRDQEKDLRLKLLEKLQQTAETEKERQRESLRSAFSKGGNKLDSVVCKARGDESVLTE